MLNFQISGYDLELNVPNSVLLSLLKSGYLLTYLRKYHTSVLVHLEETDAF